MGTSNFDRIRANSVIAPAVSTTGQVFYVNANSVLAVGGIGSSDGNSGLTPQEPLATIDAAIGKCTASRGDVIMVGALHTETVTAAITMDVAGVSIVGMPVGNKMPTVTGNGTIDAITVTAANCSIQNIEFAAPGTDAQTSDINIAAANCSVINTKHIGSTTAKNKVDIITMTADADDVLLDGVQIFNTVVEVVGGIVFEGALTNGEVRNCMVFDSIGFTGGCISDEATATGLWIHHNQFMNAKAATVVAEFGNNSTGNFSHNQVTGRHTTIASNITTGTGLNFFETYVVEQASLNGLYIPVQDAD